MTQLLAKKEVEKILKDAGIEDSGFEAEQLVLYICNTTSAKLRLLGGELTKSQQEKLMELALKRAEHYPLQYLLGEWEFYSLPFKVNENVLIPRADTEILVDTALDYIAGAQNLDIIDLCSGSGCVAVAIAANTKNCNITAAEKYKKTYEVLQSNIKLNGVKVTPILCDVLEKASGSYDLIVSNPPYIKAEVMKTLQKEVLNEPEVALNGGEDGLIFYKAILEKWLPTLKRGGAIIVEIGYDQGDPVMQLFKTAGLQNVECKLDINGNQRVIIGTLPL